MFCNGCSSISHFVHCVVIFFANPVLLDSFSSYLQILFVRCVPCVCVFSYSSDRNSRHPCWSLWWPREDWHLCWRVRLSFLLPASFLHLLADAKLQHDTYFMYLVPYALGRTTYLPPHLHCHCSLGYLLMPIFDSWARKILLLVLGGLPISLEPWKLSSFVLDVLTWCSELSRRLPATCLMSWRGTVR